MKRAFPVHIFFLLSMMFPALSSSAAETKPDTVQVGIYVTSVHNVDFRQKEYSINLWLWLKYKRPEFDFTKNLEVPMAKTFEKSYSTVDTLEDGTIYLLMKLQCVMKGTWQIQNYPFDKQKLRFSIENSNYDASQLVFVADTFGKHYGKYFLTEWQKDSFQIETQVKEYETGFGDPSLKKPHSEYSAFRATIVVHRQSWELFIKLFLGMYISLLIASVCFYIHPDNMDSRLALSVGAIFAVVGNKYVVDSSLPESNSFTLVDTLHALTLFYIFLVIAFSVLILNMIKAGKTQRAEQLNKMAGRVLLIGYVVINVVIVYIAYHKEMIGL
jgi:hypothetical protein